MSNEISIDLFERNAKSLNKKGILRDYNKILAYGSEYTKTIPLGFTNRLVLEVVVDKEYVDGLKEVFESEGYKILGGINYYFLESMVNHYHSVKIDDPKAKEGLNAIEKDYNEQKNANKPYTEKENGDVVFYIIPYKENVLTFVSFVEEMKNKVLDYATKNDITIVMNIKGFTNQINGFMGFNFMDADSEEDEGVEVDYASNIYVSVDFKKGSTVYMAAAYLNALALQKEDLELINVHILTDNAKIK